MFRCLFALFAESADGRWWIICITYRVVSSQESMSRNKTNHSAEQLSVSSFDQFFGLCRVERGKEDLRLSARFGAQFSFESKVNPRYLASDDSSISLP